MNALLYTVLFVDENLIEEAIETLEVWDAKRDTLLQTLDGLEFLAFLFLSS